MSTARPAWMARLGGVGGRTLLIAAVLVVAVAVCDRSGLQADLSADHRFSLSPRLAAILDAQQEPVELVATIGEAVAAQIPEVVSALQAMARRTPRLTWRRLDPELHRPAIEAIQARVHQTLDPGVLYVVRGERTFRIGLNLGSRRTIQREVGGALLALADPHPPTAVMLQGHGELRLDGGAEVAAENSARTLARSLSVSGFQVAALAAGRAERVPPEAVLVVPGPTSALGADLALLRDHLKDGGSALILGDDRLPDDLVRWLRLRGVLVGSGWPADPDRGLAAVAGDLVDPRSPLTQPSVVASLQHHQVRHGDLELPHHKLLLDASCLDPAHPATAPTARGGLTVLSPWSAAILPLPLELLGERAKPLRERYAAAGTPPWQTSILMRTHAGDAWRKGRAEALAVPKGLDQGDAQVLAVAMEYEALADSVRADARGRLVVWSSRQAASDAVLAQPFANAEVLVDMARWLVRRQPGQEIPEAEIAAWRIDASDGGLFAVMALLLAVVPCLFIGGAILTWLDRR